MAALVRRTSTSELIALAVGSFPLFSFTLPHGSSSSSIPLATPKLLFASRFLPFSTSSANEPPPAVEFSKGQQTVFDKLALLDELPFDSIKENKYGTIILRRKTEDEIIKIKVDPMFYHDPYGDQW